jgi:hypothetical protein
VPHLCTQFNLPIGNQNMLAAKVVLGCVHVSGDDRAIAVPLVALMNADDQLVKDAIGDLRGATIDPAVLARCIVDAVHRHGFAGGVGVVTALASDIASSPKLKALLRLDIGWFFGFLTEVVERAWTDVPTPDAEAVMNVLKAMVAMLPADIVFRGVCLRDDEWWSARAPDSSVEDVLSFQEEAECAMEYTSTLPFSAAGLELMECAAIADHVVLTCHGDPVSLSFDEARTDELRGLLDDNSWWLSNIDALLVSARACGRRAYV